MIMRLNIHYVINILDLYSYGQRSRRDIARFRDNNIKLWLRLATMYLTHTGSYKLMCYARDSTPKSF